MRLIDTNEFLRREWMMRAGMQVERRTKVLDFRDDETTEYAILSHRWIDDTEINYEEMVGLANMEEGERDAIRERLGYTKILDTCRQAQKDGYEWVWVDTCCIDKRSSAELSEAINSMYRWYRNAKTCYAYLHDVDGPSFPTKKDDEKYPKSNGWPEWFSRGWTLQEMIAPSDVQFFNKDWQPIGNKVMLAETLTEITRVPEDILTDGLNERRPCVAQIISWAADRTTTRVEDRTYSLMGLLDVNMPMLYGEGKKAFHRLQLEIIRSTNDQSIFVWGWNSRRVRIGSTLADDPSFFEGCSDIKLMNHNQFITRSTLLLSKLRWMDADHFGVFPITNRGIQIQMLLCPYRESKSVFRAYLPCESLSLGGLLGCHIDLILWNSNYYRYPNMQEAELGSPSEFRQVYLRYQDTPNHAVTFEVDDSGLIENGFTCPEHKRNIFTLTNANPFCVRTYSNEQNNCCFKVFFGECFGQHWVHLDLPLGTTAQIDLEASIARGPDWASSIPDDFVPSFPKAGQLWIRHFHLPGSPWVVRAYRVMWERSKIGVRIEVFSDPHFQNGPDQWKAHYVDVSDFLVHMDYYYHHSQRSGNDLIQDPRGLMLASEWQIYKVLSVDGHIMEFSFPGEGIKVRMYAPQILLGLTVQQLGDYGYFSDSGQFCGQGNLLSDFKSRISEADITPRQKEVTSWKFHVVDNTGMSLPSNPAFNSLLASLFPRLTNAYLVTHVVRYRQGESRHAHNLFKI